MSKNKARSAKQLQQSITAEATPGQPQTQTLSVWLAHAAELGAAGQLRAAERVLVQLSQQEKGSHACKQLLQLYIGNSWFYEAHLQLQALDPTRDDV